MISLHAMRVGPAEPFMGMLGIIVGVLTAIPLLGGAPVVQLFWLVAMAMLFLNRWPQGRGPAWDSGEAIPWPSAADKRDELRGTEPPARGRAGRQRARLQPEEDAETSRSHTREAARPRAVGRRTRAPRSASASAAARRALALATSAGTGWRRRPGRAIGCGWGFGSTGGFASGDGTSIATCATSSDERNGFFT